MDPALIAILGLLIGLALLVVEFFLPSGGLILVLAVVSLTAGVWGAWKAWGDTAPTGFAIYLGVMLVGVPSSLIAGLYLLNNTKLGEHVLLPPPNPEDISSVHSPELQELVGQRGKTMGLLNPGGLVLVEGTRYHCESQGMMIDPGTEVEVLAVKLNSLVVRVPLTQPMNLQKAEASPPEVDASESEPTVAATEGDSSESLESFDFDVPEDV